MTDSPDDPDNPPRDGEGPVVHARDVPEKVERLKRLSRRVRGAVNPVVTLDLDVAARLGDEPGLRERVNRTLRQALDTEDA